MNGHEEPSIVKTVEMKHHPFSKSAVDIIIPFHGQYDRVISLINSIIISVKSNPYQITLIDDGSSNKEFVNQFKDFDKGRPAWAEPILKVIRNKERFGFANSVRIGLQNTKQAWCMIMHSDCIVEDPQWMIEMGKSILALKNNKVKMIGPKNQHKSINAQRQPDVVLGDDGFLPLFCVLFHRELFAHIGGYIKDYPGYEDEELAHRMHYYGYKQAICGNSYATHVGGCTYEALIKENPELRQEIDNNRDRVVADLQNLYQR